MPDPQDLTLPPIAEGEDKSSPLCNRIRNNYRHLRKWAKRTSTDCFRLYDRAIPQYPLIIDFYAGRFCVHYISPSRDKPEPSPELIEEIHRILGSLFNIPEVAINWRTRRKTKQTRQYEKKDTAHEFFTVHEYGIKFKINLKDYLDTGLFLDHRETRQQVAALSKSKRVLNLFAYTCSFSVHAAAAGASYTKSVDMSNTYTAWGKDNFRLNALSLKNNDIVRADCLKFIDDEVWTGTKYDIIIIDPPTVSRSKKMSGLFEIQTDYVTLLSKALLLLNQEGIIFFSTNSRKFKLDETLFKECKIQEITAKTIPWDFHDKTIHRCWKISPARA